jgi:DNA-binding NtrC family response regulator
MSLLSDVERARLEDLRALSRCNPFTPARVEAERRVLGAAFVAEAPVWTPDLADPDNPRAAPERANVSRLRAFAAEMVEALRARLSAGQRATAAERGLYADLVQYHLFSAFESHLLDHVLSTDAEGPAGPVACWPAFLAEHTRLAPGAPELPEAPVLFALAYQLRRAFHAIFRHLHGISAPAAALRADVWTSVFTHDLARHARALTERLADVPTLVTGPTGTGKELVARAIALSAHLPFDPRTRRFAAAPEALFTPVALAALAPGVVESELFGHARGAFTGAVAARAGYLEPCLPQGTVFLDEIGELDAAVQVKLLRVLESRVFQRIGETRPRRFLGRVVCATHRDLAAEVQGGRFRDDLYYRLCADRVRTPTLAERFAADERELPLLCAVIARRVVGPEEAPALAGQVVEALRRHPGPAHTWPGNIRELTQAVRSVLLRGEYRPDLGAPDASGGPAMSLAADLQRGALDAETLLDRYCALVYAATGSYVETAARLGLDRRTVKARVGRGLEKTPQNTPATPII